MTTPPFRCSDAARERGDPPLGTAPTAPAYLLIEHPGPWRYDAPAGAGWSPSVAAGLTSAARTSRARLLLVRRPGRQLPSAARAWAVCTVSGGTSWGTWRKDGDLLEAAALLRTPPNGRPVGSSAPLLLVCTHGVHDACCAVRGRPVAAALARRWPEATWECSHVGGDRFAPNLVVLPDGTYYGGLDAATAGEVVDGHLAGRLDTVHLRGSVRWPPAAQVAVGEVHRRFGPFGVDDVRADSWTDRGPTRWLVAVSIVDGRRFAVEVVAGRRTSAALTCSAAGPTSAHDFQATAVTPAGTSL